MHLIDYSKIELEKIQADGMLSYIDLETMYCNHVEANFDMNLIKKSGLHLAYDAMYGAGQGVMPLILPNVALLHCDYNPSFMGQAPEPISKNLQELSKYITDHKNIHCGLATDGDADRIGLYNGKGEFVISFSC
jgi:phosphomannomutase